MGEKQLGGDGQRYKFHLYKISSRDLLFSTVPLANNSVMYI